MKTYFVLSGQGGELARHDATGKADDRNYTTELIRWLQQDHIVTEPGDTITIEEVE